MLVYPQLTNVALAQFPVRRHHRLRTIVNTAADDSTIKLGDPGAETVEWQLQYTGLTDSELATLQQFFVSAEGSLHSFVFVDPTANLLAWSSDLDNVVWTAGPLLSKSGGGADPDGGNGAWHVVNSGAGRQQLSQTLSAPGSYVYCFSLFVRAVVPATVTLFLGGLRVPQACGPAWKRVSCAATGDASASSMTFGFELEAGAAVDVYGPQVEPQASPSMYKASTTTNCYEDARFREDSFAFTSTGVNCHNATANIIHASHI